MIVGAADQNRGAGGPIGVEVIFGACGILKRHHRSNYADRACRRDDHMMLGSKAPVQERRNGLELRIGRDLGWGPGWTGRARNRIADSCSTAVLRQLESDGNTRGSGAATP